MSATIERPSEIQDAPLGQTRAGVAVSQAAAEVAERMRPSVVMVLSRGGNGAGVIWRSDGQIVTNNHVVRGDHAEVILSDGRRLTATLAARHPDRDIALLRIDADGLPAAEVADSSTVRPGQVAIAIGHPIGFREAVTVGVVVAAGQMATEKGPQTGDFLQTDVTLLPGNSGGPLVDAWGRVIGINTMVNGRLSLAIPSQAVERFVIGGGGRGVIGYLGVNGIIVQTRRDDSPVAFLLTEIVEGTPADRAGLIVGDVVVAIGGQAITDQESLPAALIRLVPGEAVTLDVLRGGEPRSFVVVPTERV
jgi:serine protease Do